jgi:uncharacterized protein YfbU (UPF0304 family)
MPVKLSDGERLILFMLTEIYQHFKIEGEVDPSFIADAVAGGHDWALESEYSGLFPTADNDKDVHETHEILTMFRILENSLDNLSPADRKRVDEAVPPFDGNDLRFKGFDGNNDPHIGIARFLVEKMGLYAEQKGRALDAHSSVLDSYRRMHDAYEPMLETLHTGTLTADQLIAILKARIHPSLRK